MSDFFEIFGTLIRYDDIKDFRIVQREYIYRPTYKEVEEKVFFQKRSKYVFAGMQPYAAIIDEKGGSTQLSKYKANSFKETAAVDVFHDIRTTIGDKFNIKSIRSKKYTCLSQTGRVFQTYMEDIPALLGRADGKFSDIMKNDELYHLLGEPIAPAINIIPALMIKAKEDYIFFGAGIQVNDIESDFQRLKYELDAYSQQKKLSTKNIVGFLSKGKQKLQLPNKKTPALMEKNVTNDIANLKQALEDGIISKEEYEEKISKVIENI
ncbi:MAG: hypothetical protein MJ172_11505 [Clostridia bacterium]|nr:hypothetical protein [Clostridia bacterium]